MFKIVSLVTTEMFILVILGISSTNSFLKGSLPYLPSKGFTI